jgi:alanine racemase
VKANAYGHGAVKVARALVDAGCPLLAVALVEEGLELREAGIAVPVLVLGAAYDDEYDVLVRQRLTPIIFTAEHVRRLAAAARAAGTRASAHVEVETGMGRIGIQVAEIPALLDALRASPEVRVEGLCTHFACADVAPRATTERQVAIFAEVARSFEAAGFHPKLHLANSAGTVEYASVRQDLTRPGIMLYGYLPFARGMQLGAAAEAASSRLERALTWRTAITHVKTVTAGTPVSYGGHWVANRTSRIATLPVGYGDGYRRAFSGRPDQGRADVLVRGMRAPVAGTVCMDMTMVDVTGIPGAAVGDDVVLLGAQGAETIDADELAAKAGTISYEILCGIGRRVPRRYV